MPARVAAVVPAKDEADLVAATVAALLGLATVDVVIVVDDGSTDETPLAAARAGAIVVRHPQNLGKGAALTTGVSRLVEEEVRRGSEEHLLLLFADADLGDSAAHLAPLLDPVLAGEADLTVATMPRSATSLGSGRVVRLARGQIEALTGHRLEQPLNGMRCLTRETFTCAQPLAPGWGVEAAMLVDVLRAGLRVLEVPVDLTHRRSGSDITGRLHRARQLRDVSRALLSRRFLT